MVAREALDHNYQDRLRPAFEADAMERGKALLRTLRFSKDDYVYANNQQGIAVANPNPKVEGKNMLDVADPDGVFFVRRQLELATNGGGFLLFRFPRAAGGDQYQNLFMPFNSNPSVGSWARAFISTTSAPSSGSRLAAWR